MTVTVAPLMDCFRDGLIALIPIAERSGIASLPKYAGIYEDWSVFSFLTERCLMHNGAEYHLCSLGTTNTPFDHAEFVQLDRVGPGDPYESVIRPYDQCEWVLNARVGGELRALTEISY